jgi:hypothetical protein
MNYDPIKIFSTIVDIRKRGLETLNKKLGPVATICFLRILHRGLDDYYADTQKLLSILSFDDIVNNLKEIRPLKSVYQSYLNNNSDIKSEK